MAAASVGLAAEPELLIRGRTIMALVLVPEFPITAWFAALDERMAEAVEFFAGRPVVVDLSAVAGGGPDAPPIVLEGLEARDLRLVGVEGVAPEALAGTRWRPLASALQGREVSFENRPLPSRDYLGREAVPEVRAPSLLIDEPVRSGQSIVFEEGDVTVLGSVASGAEVIAGGSVHVYGALRGRALAGLKSGEAARIFCRRLEAEMVGIHRLYRTADNWGPELQGRPAQVRCDRGALRVSPLI